MVLCEPCKCCDIAYGDGTFTRNHEQQGRRCCYLKHAKHALQDVLGDATKTSESREIGGQLYYNIDIDSPVGFGVAWEQGGLEGVFAVCCISLFVICRRHLTHVQL